MMEENDNKGEKEKPKQEDEDQICVMDTNDKGEKGKTMQEDEDQICAIDTNDKEEKEKTIQEDEDQICVIDKNAENEPQLEIFKDKSKGNKFVNVFKFNNNKTTKASNAPDDTGANQICRPKLVKGVKFRNLLFNKNQRNKEVIASENEQTEKNKLPSANDCDDNNKEKPKQEDQICVIDTNVENEPHEEVVENKAKGDKFVNFFKFNNKKTTKASNAPDDTGANQVKLSKLLKNQRNKELIELADEQTENMKRLPSVNDCDDQTHAEKDKPKYIGDTNKIEDREYTGETIGLEDEVEAKSDKDVQTFNQVKEKLKQYSLFVLQLLKCNIQFSIQCSRNEGLANAPKANKANIVLTVVENFAGFLLPGSKIPAKAAHKLINKLAEKGEKKQGHNTAKNIARVFENFENELKTKWEQIILDFSVQIFACYNIQFCHLLTNPEDGDEKLMYKLAEDTVHRVYTSFISNSIEYENKNPDNMVKYLVSCFCQGESEKRSLNMKRKKFNTHEVFDKSDILYREQFILKRKQSPSETLYRHPLLDETEDAMKSKWEEQSSLCERKNYKLNFELLTIPDFYTEIMDDKDAFVEDLCNDALTEQERQLKNIKQGVDQLIRGGKNEEEIKRKYEEEIKRRDDEIKQLKIDQEITKREDYIKKRYDEDIKQKEEDLRRVINDEMKRKDDQIKMLEEDRKRRDEEICACFHFLFKKNKENTQTVY